MENNYIKQYETHQKAVFESANEVDDNQESEKPLWWDDASYAAYQAEDRFAYADWLDI